SATSVASTITFKNPQEKFQGSGTADLANEVLKARWAAARPSSNVGADAWLIDVARSANVPVIPPAGVQSSGETAGSGMTEGTAVERQLSGQDWLCKATQNTSVLGISTEWA
ncbi:hypothetical protein, partial [Pseudomonas aeruginosa]|uniref:hypothetical protein n=1 Tax=Pseudomonas aeruginosa TaxID=287 RepID=UPI0031B6EFE0